MKIMIDTNIILDIFTRRMPWFKDSYTALSIILRDPDNECLFSASAVTDVFYLLHKTLADQAKAKEVIETLSRLTNIADVQSVDIQNALNSPLPDFEDAVVDSVAARHNATYILTRNQKDFSSSAVPAITPSEYIKKH